ncbi:MAG: hypothetical protein KKA84_14295 [Bacteroidetes bacterium]|nr:hypothetical protein [Bacteroidota bacterium]
MKIFVLFFIIIFISLSYSQIADKTNYYFVFLRSNPDKEKLCEVKVNALQEAHMKNIEDLHKAGKLVAAGPFDGGGGIFILKSGSIEESTSDFMSDPAIKANRFRVDIHPVKFYKGKICPVGEEYEMVTYKFIEFIPQSQLSNCCAQELNSVLEKYAEEGNTIASLYFSDAGGGVVISDRNNEDEFKNELDKIEFIAEGKVNYTIRNLWIAKETFCEE